MDSQSIMAALVCCLLGLATRTFALSSSVSSSGSGSSKSYDLLVIGGGSAGLTAAKFAATFGKTVAIVEKDKLGGDCTWTGCVPSKSLLAASKAAHAVQKAKRFGITVGSKSSGDDNENNDNEVLQIDMKAVKARVQQNIQHIYQEDDSPEALEKLGIDSITGAAKFQDPKTLQVSSTTTSTTTDTLIVEAKDGILIATGAGPILPPIPGLDTVPYLTYEDAFDIDTIPNKMAVVGGGPIGVELAQAYSRLGADVTVVADGLLPMEEPEVGVAMKRVFEGEGIQVTNSRLAKVQESESGDSGKSLSVAVCENGESVPFDLILVAVGRKPVVNGMGLEDLGVELNENGGILIDPTLQTTVKSVYAAGDCTGDKQFTHYAGYQGAVGARNILLPFSDPGVLDTVPATTFCDPEIASVGLTEAQAKETHGANRIGVAMKKISETDRGICEGINEGFIKIIYSKKGNKILGATLMSPVAGEAIAEIGVAMKAGLSFDMLATVVHTYPSHSFAIQAMAAELYYDKLVKLKPILNFLKRLGL